MMTYTLDAKGLKCPHPTLKMTGQAFKMKAGDVLEVTADCSTFEKDVRDWCSRSKMTLLWIRDVGTAKICQVRC
jgi:tRNA 2-thiouridine synthesizing protein A